MAPVTQPTLRAAGPAHVWGLGGQDLHEQPGKVKVNTSDPASHITLQFASAPSRDCAVLLPPLRMKERGR